MLNKKFKVSNTDVVNYLTECENNTQVYINSEITIYKECEISAQYGLSFYDSLIIASALECDCAILYSEDLNDSPVIEGRLKIVNPFV